jgi:hypothetical protein
VVIPRKKGFSSLILTQNSEGEKVKIEKHFPMLSFSLWSDREGVTLRRDSRKSA